MFGAFGLTFDGSVLGAWFGVSLAIAKTTAAIIVVLPGCKRHLTAVIILAEHALVQVVSALVGAILSHAAIMAVNQWTS